MVTARRWLSCPTTVALTGLPRLEARQHAVKGHLAQRGPPVEADQDVARVNPGAIRGAAPYYSGMRYIVCRSYRRPAARMREREQPTCHHHAVIAQHIAPTRGSHRGEILTRRWCGQAVSQGGAMPEMSPAAQVLARRVLRHEAGGRAEPAALAEAAERADARLRGRLASPIRQTGYTTLVAHAGR